MYICQQSLYGLCYLLLVSCCCFDIEKIIVKKVDYIVSTGILLLKLRHYASISVSNPSTSPFEIRYRFRCGFWSLIDPFSPHYLSPWSVIIMLIIRSAICVSLSVFMQLNFRWFIMHFTSNLREPLERCHPRNLFFVCLFVCFLILFWA